MLLRFAPLLAGLNLVWEIAQLPLYTIWHEPDLGKIAFAVLHCAAGDIGIGVSALLLGLLISRAKEPRTWPYPRLAATMTIIAVAYTAFSEWLNARVLHSWAYSDLMPVISPWEIGVTPLLQWVVIPPLALALAMMRTRAFTMRNPVE